MVSPLTTPLLLVDRQELHLSLVFFASSVEGAECPLRTSVHVRPAALYAHTHVAPCEIHKPPQPGLVGVRQHLYHPTGVESAIEETEQRLARAEEGNSRSQCTALDLGRVWGRGRGRGGEGRTEDGRRSGFRET